MMRRVVLAAAYAEDRGQNPITSATVRRQPTKQHTGVAWLHLQTLCWFPECQTCPANGLLRGDGRLRRVVLAAVAGRACRSRSIESAAVRRQPTMQPVGWTGLPFRKPMRGLQVQHMELPCGLVGWRHTVADFIGFCPRSSAYAAANATLRNRPLPRSNPLAGEICPLRSQHRVGKCTM